MQDHNDCFNSTLIECIIFGFWKTFLVLTFTFVFRRSRISDMIKDFNLFYFYYHIKFHWILGLGHTQWEKLRASEVRGFPYSHHKMPNYGTGPHTSTHSEWNHHVLLMSNNCVGELATQADGGPPSAAGRGKTPVSCDPPPCPPPMCITAPPAMVVLSPPCLTSGPGESNQRKADKLETT